MKTIARYDKLRIPAYTLPYLVNGDASGLTPPEVAVIDAYMSAFYTVARAQGGHVIFSPEAEAEEYFTSAPEFGQPCTVEDCTILIVM